METSTAVESRDSLDALAVLRHDAGLGDDSMSGERLTCLRFD